MYPRKKYRTIWVKDEGSWAGLGSRARHATGLGPTGLGATGLGATGLGPTGVGPTGVGPTGVVRSTINVTPTTAPSIVLIVTNLSYEPVGQIVTI